jgi:long-chain acyl-CoA synthetase
VFGEAVAAFVEVDAAHNPSVADLAEHCRSALAGYKCPRQISIVDALPRNAMGKVDKVALRRAAWAEADRRIAGG